MEYMSDEGELEKDHILCGQEIKEQLRSINEWEFKQAPCHTDIIWDYFCQI